MDYKTIQELEDAAEKMKAHSKSSSLIRDSESELFAAQIMTDHYTETTCFWRTRTGKK